MAKPYRSRTVLSVTRAYSHDPLERIEAISGVNPDRTRWSLSQSAAIAAIEARTDEFFVTEAGLAVRLVVLTHRSQKYLATEHQGVESAPDQRRAN
jgi:hypothetical protein